jgi:transcriptional regulator with XRE-family HTH domain
MGRQSPVETRFRERVKQERARHGWSQADLSKRLQAKGLQHMLPSTVAKIENGDRAVRIDEANALADLLAVSVDELLGRNLPERDLTSTLQELMETARQAHSQVDALEASLRALTVELAGFQFDERDGDITAASEQACAALAAASEALARLYWTPGPTLAAASFNARTGELINRLPEEARRVMTELMSTAEDSE